MSGKELVTDTIANKEKNKVGDSQGGWEAVQERKYTHSNDYLTHIEEHLHSHDNINPKYYRHIEKVILKVKLMSVDYSFEKLGYGKKKKVQGRETQWPESVPYLIL